MADSTSKPLLIVAGLGRCGLTMTMNMIHAAGIPCAGSTPAFEDTGLYGVGRINRPGLRATADRGQVVKWVDPINCPPAGMATRSIFLRRDPLEQARSQVKFVALLSSSAVPSDRRTIRAMAAANRRDREATRKLLTAGGPVLEMTFEEILAEPARSAAIMLAWFRAPGGVDQINRAAAVVLPRDPKCQPGLAIEAAMRGDMWQ